MSVFKNLFGKKEKIAPGIHIEQDREGYYLVKQTKINLELICTDDYEKALESAERLNELANWDTDVNVPLYFEEKRKDVWSKYKNIQSKYQVQRITNGLYLKTLDEEGNVDYQILDENDRKKKVKGILITEGLGIHQDALDVWTIDHIPSCYMLTELPTKQMAIKVAEAIKPLLDWKESDIPSIMLESKELIQYMKVVKEAVNIGMEIPSVPRELDYQLIFLQMPQIKKNWKIFSEAWNELESMVGLEDVKDKIMKLLGQIRGRMKNKGKVKEKRASMHMVFAGPPGTGKTEVARVISRLLFALGYLSKNICVEVDRAKIISPNIGQSEKNMEHFIHQAMGGVLFIDEAYSLARHTGTNDFGTEVIDTLIKSMEDNREDFIVILAGYPNDMQRLMEANEGFQSRIRYNIFFRDYTPEQLTEIAIRMIYSHGYETSESVRKAIKKAIESKTKNGTLEGNARKVRSLVEDIIDELNVRVGRTNAYNSLLVTPEDVKEATTSKLSINEQEGLIEIRKQALEELENLIGMKELKEQVKQILNRIAIERQRFEKGISTEKPRLHMIFTGPPGTGKTTVARIIGKFFKGSGLLSSGHFKEVTRAELVGQYQGHTTERTKEAIQKSLGGVLFIDEAYSLHNGENDTFGKEIIDTLVPAMENYRDDLVVILAGYEEPMQKLLDVNEGLRSRIPFQFDFPNYTANDIYEITKIILRKNYLFFEEDVEEILKEVIYSYGSKHEEKFDGNGRWADNLVDRIKDIQTNRLAQQGIDDLTEEDLVTVTEEDFKKAITLM